MTSCARPCGYGRLIAYIRECDTLSQRLVVRWLVAFFGHHGVSFRSAFVWRAGAGPRTHVVGGSVRGARLRLLCPRALVVASCRRCPRVCPLLPASVWFWSSSRVFLSGLIGCVAVASRVLLARRRSWRFYSAPSRPCSRLWFFFKRRARPSRWATFSGGVSVDVLFVPWLVAAFGNHGVSFRSACVPLFVLSSACLCKPCQT